MNICPVLIPVICLGFIASCTTEPDGSRALRSGGPSLEECVSRANGVYLARVEHGGDSARYIVEEVWRHDPILGARPEIGEELPRPGGNRPFGGTVIPDHVVAFRFRPPLEREGHGATSEREASVFDGYVRIFDLSARRLRQLVQTAPYQPTKPFELRPLGRAAPGARPALLRVGDSNRTFPRAVFRPAPVYPPELRARGISGEALIDVHVLPDGTVGDTQIVRADDIRFGEAAEACVRQWRFEPATKDGEPVEARMQIPIVFSIR